MDTFTHTVAGLALSRAGLNRWTPRAAPLLMLAANAPDIDVVSAAGGPLAYLHWHRNITHSLAAMPVLALLTVLVVRFAGRKPLPWLSAFSAALIGVASHLLLDWTNMYGVRLLLPFSAEWLQLDLTSVIDLWIWAALLLALAGPFIGRLVGSEIASRNVKDRRHGRGFAIFALLFLLCYNCGRGVLHARALNVLASRLYRDTVPSRVAALPNPAAPWRWRGLVESGDFYAVEDVDLAGQFDPARATYFPKPQEDPAIDAARRSPAMQGFLRFAQYPLWRVTPAAAPENSRLVEAFDLRFGTPQSPGFMASALVDSQHRVIRASVSFGTLRPK